MHVSLFAEYLLVECALAPGTIKGYSSAASALVAFLAQAGKTAVEADLADITNFLVQGQVAGA